MSAHLSGSCLCQTIKYIVTEEISSVVNCHCKICKKNTGAAFETVAVINFKSLEFTAGVENLSVYQVTDRAQKHFCKTCGTPIYNLHKLYRGRCMLHVGSINHPEQVTPAFNVYCESMLPWVRTIGEIPCFEQLPPR